MQFSIIIPVYNEAEFLNRCLDSIMAQTFIDFEAILVDDGSTDGSEHICDAYAEKDPHFRVIHKENGGLVSARNVGLFEAKGEYITYIDGDDWADPNMLQYVHDRLEESQVPLDMVLFGAEAKYSDRSVRLYNHVPEGNYDRKRLEKEVFPILLSDRRKGFRLGSAITGHTWNKYCRRELQLENYVRDERIKMFTDVPLTYECLLNCQNVYIGNEPLYYYNKTNKHSITTVRQRNYLTQSFGYLISYLHSRLKGHYGPVIDRELNDYPVHLIISCAIWRLTTEKSFFSAVKEVKDGLKESGMLQYIHLKGLPKAPAILVLLLKMHLYVPAMILCNIKRHQAKKS